MKTSPILRFAVLLAAVIASTAFGQLTTVNITDSQKGISYAGNVTTVTTSYAPTLKDHTILASASSSAITINLPPAKGRHQVLVVRKTDASANAVTLDGWGPETIDGATTLALAVQYQTVTLQAVDNAWQILNGGVALRGDLTLTSDPTGGNLGASSTLTAVLNSALVPFATMTDGTASVKTKALMDDTPAAEFSAVTVTAAPTDTEDASYARIGSKSLKLAWPATSVAGDGIMWTAFSGENWEAQESVGFWIYASETLAAGDLTFVTVDSTGDVAFNVPAVTVANKWVWVEVDISSLAGGTGDAVTNYKILLSSAGATAHAAFNTYIDGAYKWDATEELALGVDLIDQPGAVRSVLAMTKANTGTHDMARLVEGTDFFVHTESGNDFLVTISNQSAASAFALVHHK